MNTTRLPQTGQPNPFAPAWDLAEAPVATDRYRIDLEAPATAADLDVRGDLAERMRAAYADCGLVHVTNTGLRDLDQMRVLARHVLTAEARYDGGANPRAHIGPNVYEVGAPISAALHYHHEMAYVGTSPDALALLCADVTPGVGPTYVSDNLQATDAILATPLGERLRDRGVIYHRDLTDRSAFAGTDGVGVYNHWQQSFGTEDPDEAEARARAQGLEVEWGPNRLLRTRYRADAFEYWPEGDRNLLFSSLADDGLWFDSWPGVMHMPMEERPLRMTYGDGEPFSDADKRLFLDVYARAGQRIDWARGDVLIVCNYRFAHGRPGIDLLPDQVRTLGVLIGSIFEREGQRASAW